MRWLRRALWFGELLEVIAREASQLGQVLKGLPGQLCPFTVSAAKRWERVDFSQHLLLLLLFFNSKGEFGCITWDTSFSLCL